MGSALLLAVVLGSGKIPIPESSMRFPDSAAYVGSGLQREANMLAAAVRDSGLALRYQGPGPEQIAARWFAGSLNVPEKVVVLLGGGVFHNRSMLPVYMDAMSSPDLRVRQAAAAGFFSLAGLSPPLPSQLPDDPGDWRRLRRMIRALAWTLDERSLVGVWVDSYLASEGMPLSPHAFTFQVNGPDCLRTIRELAAPEDLPEILALWPLIRNTRDRFQVVGTIEMITLQRLNPRSLDPRQPSGDWQASAAAAAVDQWVAGLCRSVDGEEQLALGLKRNDLVGPNGRADAAAWAAVIRFRYPPFLPLAAERLMDLGSRAVTMDRQSPEDPANQAVCGTLLEQFPISAAPPEGKSHGRGVESRRNRP